MRDAVSLIGKVVTIDNTKYLIKDFCYLPNNDTLHVKVTNAKKKNITINFPYLDLLESFKTQIKSCRLK
jgi:hypothetical protein